MSIDQIVEKILEKPYYLKDGFKRMAERLNLPLEDVKAAFEKARTLKKKGGIQELEDHLTSRGLELKDVKKIKLWQNFSGEHRFSIDTKENWYEKSTNELVDLFKEEIKKELTPSFDIPKKEGTLCAVLSMSDLHLDKVSIVSETGQYSDVDSNIEKALGGFYQLVGTIQPYSVSEVVLIVGSDVFNANDARNTTVKGTPQDVHYGWHEQFIKIYKFYVACVELLLQSGYTVHIKVVEGNHDADKCFYLGQLLETKYEQSNHVFIDCSRKPRKYYVWGGTLLGFAHGDKEKKYVSTLPVTMFLENKDIMPEINYAEFLLGDIHHQETFQTKKTQDFKGCTVRFLRAVSELGRWEFSEGYVGIPKSMDAFVYSKTNGLKANLQIHL